MSFNDQPTAVVTCGCDNPHHTLIFEHFQPNELYTFVALSAYKSFCGRLWCALCYLFGAGQLKYAPYDTVVWTRKDAREVHALLAEFLRVERPED